MVEGINVEIWVVGETRIHTEIPGEMRGKFRQTCKSFNSPENDIRSSLDSFHTTRILPMSL